MHRLLKSFVEVKKVLLGKKEAGRALTAIPDDIFVVSYPRSGNTWTRFLIGNLVHENQPVTFLNVESLVPSIYMCPDRVLRKVPRPRILKSHECFDARYKNVIYIVRDPRDVAVSFYHFNIKVGRLTDDYPMERFIEQLLAAEIDGDVDRYGSWDDNVLSWINMQHTRRKFLLLRYEDMLADPQRELAKVAHFLGFEPRPERLAKAVELSSADRMRNLERNQAGEWTMMRGTRQDKPFVRSARSGGWRSVLPERAVAAIEAAWGSTMELLGYELASLRTGAAAVRE